MPHDLLYACTRDIHVPEMCLLPMGGLPPMETCNTMVEIQNSCQKFNNNYMANWLLVTNQTIQYCQYAIELLTGFGESSLKAQWGTLLDKKYATEASQNNVAFQDAAQASNAILLELSTVAKEKATEVDKLIVELQATMEFLGDTIANEARIQFLRQQYHDGPVTIGKTKIPSMGADGQPQKPYAFWLQSELETLRANITAAFKEYNDTFDDWALVATTAVTYMWVPVFGFIAGSVVMGIHADKARRAHNLYEEQKAHAEKLVADEAPLVKLPVDIRMLGSQHEDMATRMHSAIAALNEIKQLFLAQSLNFGLVASMMGLAKGKVQASLFLQQSVDKAVKNWQEVSELAKEFLATADVKTAGITPDVKPPME
ncbi:hypothetical protein EJ02DRAFT_513372 [Clathrospora elynae]|uniref:Uncharacterized protein n=1 Tax=Clathrospora elynae TaxID=706981 RepID=A0A6A5SHD6_9PLEO|nr:hypothetical protein EJ02DRAFT_513372 [Clathrospora elynae]